MGYPLRGCSTKNIILFNVLCLAIVLSAAALVIYGTYTKTHTAEEKPRTSLCREVEKNNG